MNPNITVDIIMKHPRHNWNNFLFTANPNFEFAHTFMTEDIFGDHIFEWNWLYMTFHKNVTWDIIHNNRNRPWNLSYISRNPNIPVEVIRKYLSDPSKNLFDFSPRTHIKTWNRNFLSGNPCITIDLVKEFPDSNWNWPSLSKNPSITLKDISENLFPWDWFSISQNPNLQWTHVKKNLDKNWNWEALSKHPNITFDTIFTNPHLPWDHIAFNQNPNLTWDIIEKHQEIRWNHYLLSRNPMPYYCESAKKQRCFERCALFKEELLYS